MTHLKDPPRWIVIGDLETTGLDPTQDYILEVAFSVVDMLDGGPLDISTEAFAEPVNNDPFEWEERLRQDPVVHEMHLRNGLLDEIHNGFGLSLPDLNAELIEFFAPFTEDGLLPIAGRGFGRFDRLFLQRFLPNIDRLFTYWDLDVSTLDRVHQMIHGTPMVPPEEPRLHRAVVDVRQAARILDRAIHPAMATFGVDTIARERLRQIAHEGYTHEHDSAHTEGELSRAAACYVRVAEMATRGYDVSGMPCPIEWPWRPAEWKPDPDPIRNLAKAGAMIAAEIDRLRS